MNTEQAMDIVRSLTSDSTLEHGTACLEDKFWVWETLEDSLRGHVEHMSFEDTMRVWGAFSTHLKGSEDMYDMLE